MKNLRTPRTLSETTFTTGYPDDQRLSSRWGTAVYAVIVVVCFAALGVMFGWRG